MVDVGDGLLKLPARVSQFTPRVVSPRRFNALDPWRTEPVPESPDRLNQVRGARLGQFLAHPVNQNTYRVGEQPPSSA